MLNNLFIKIENYNINNKSYKEILITSIKIGFWLAILVSFIT